MENEAHIYIYGVIDSWQDAEASNYGYVNLTDVRNQLENQKNFESIVVHIHSEGGVVTEGFAIHDFIRSQGVPVTTIIDGVCASIATVILLAGDVRIGTENAKPFIHNPWGMAGGDKEELRKYADELETMENDIASFYSSKTKLSTDDALNFMRNETFFTAEEALANGFLTKIETVMRAVALLNNSKKEIMPKTKVKKDENANEQLTTMFDEMFAKIKNVLKGDKKKAMNKIVTDATGAEILFPDVEDDAQEVVGDSATIDGQAAEGDVLMPDGSTYVFADGKLSEIKEAEKAPEDDVEALKIENETLKQENADLKAAQAKFEKDAKAEKKSMKAEVKEIKNSLKEMQKNIGGNFEYKPEKKNFKKQESGARSVWKKTEE